MLKLPPLYPITDARLECSLSEQIRRLGEAGFPLVQFRGKPLDAKEQWIQLRKALSESALNGGWPLICVNDRADLALLAAREGLAPWGLHLGQGDIPPAEAQALPGLAGLHFGTSTHEDTEWLGVDPACDHAGIGPFRATSTKGDHARPIGLEGLRAGCAVLRSRGLAPVAIGGLDLEDAQPCYEAGAESLAMVGEVGRSQEPRELLWRAQIARWQARLPIRRGCGLILVGGSGCGKTALAEALGRRMRMSAADLDVEAERLAGKAIARIFAEAGEPAFRDLEDRALSKLLSVPCVISLGGGAWECEGVRKQIRSAEFQVLWINENPLVAWNRVAQDPHRPLAGDRAAFLDRWRRRMPRWEEAPMILPLGRSPEILAETLVP